MSNSMVEEIAERIATAPALLKRATVLAESEHYLRTELDRQARHLYSDKLTVTRNNLARSPDLADFKIAFCEPPELHRAKRSRGLRQLGIGTGAAIGAGGYHELAPLVLDSAFPPDAAEILTVGPVILTLIGAIGSAVTGLIVLSTPKSWTNTAAWRRTVAEAAQLAVTQHRDPTHHTPQFATTTAGDVQQTLTDLLAEWAAYKLDIEAWYLTKPLLHDTTGTVATTVAYERAMHDLAEAVDTLHSQTPQPDIDHASALADTAWRTWYEANEYAAATGLGDRTPTERAALQRLGKLVARITRSSATDPELPMIKRDIESCLHKITTIAVGWSDIAALPEVERAGTLPQLTARTQS